MVFRILPVYTCQIQQSAIKNAILNDISNVRILYMTNTTFRSEKMPFKMVFRMLVLSTC